MPPLNVWVGFPELWVIIAVTLIFVGTILAITAEEIKRRAKR